MQLEPFFNGAYRKPAPPLPCGTSAQRVHPKGRPQLKATHTAQSSEPAQAAAEPRATHPARPQLGAVPPIRPEPELTAACHPAQRSVSALGPAPALCVGFAMRRARRSPTHVGLWRSVSGGTALCSVLSGSVSRPALPRSVSGPGAASCSM